MKINLFTSLLFVINICFAQKSETINIPKGVVYNYCQQKTIEKAKKLITENLSGNNDYKLLTSQIIIGPELWKRFKDNENLKILENGNVDFHVDNIVLKGKRSQTLPNSKIIWDEFKKDVSKNFKIRKANENELKYYWSIISFDIEEPLLIVESNEDNYILNLSEKDLKLTWLELMPKLNRGKSNPENMNFKTYQNGKENNVISKGLKESKLEKVILLSSDEELKENSSLEEIQLVLSKTNLIFESLFKNSEKSGKIMVEIELGTKKNIINFAVKDNIDLEIMKMFEKNINNENYPNTKKDSIKMQLIYKVNSFNDTE